MTADVQRELAAALDDTATGLWMAQHGPGWGNTIAAALLPTVQRLIADAEKRGAAAALRDAADAAACTADRYKLNARARMVAEGEDPDRPAYAAALDPAGAASGETT